MDRNLFFRNAARCALAPALLITLLTTACTPPPKVTLNWRTESERDNYGFYLMRSESPDGPFSRINDRIIAGHGTTNVPSEYEYIDYDVEYGRTYYYSLYSVSYNGEEEMLYTIPHEVTHDRLF